MFDPNNERDKQMCVMFAFNSDFSEIFAYTHAQNSFSSITREEVTQFYESFRNGGRIDKEGTSDESKKASLGNVPPEILEEILSHSTTMDQKALHKTSFGLSSFVSDTFKTFEEIHVYLTTKDVRVQLKEQKPNVIRGVPMKRKLEETEGSTRKTIPEALSILRSTFETPNIKIKKLVLTYKLFVKNGKRRDELYSGILEILKGLKHEIHVEILDIGIQSVDFLMEVLKKIKVGPLAKLIITNNEYGMIRGEDKKLILEDIVDSPHWKHIYNLSGRSVKFNLHMDEFVHMRCAGVEVTKPTIKEILSFRDKIIEQPQQVLHVIGMKIPKGLMAALKPFTPIQDVFGEGGSYPCKKGGRLNVTLKDEEITFRTDFP